MEDKTKVAAPATTVAPKLSNLKPAETEKKEPKVSKRTLSEEDYKKYCAILMDGKAHKIKDLLETFGLERTNAGREKLRAANRQINQSGLGKVDPVFIDGEGKHFLLVPNGKA